jgi:hypothetical protein
VARPRQFFLEDTGGISDIKDPIKGQGLRPPNAASGSVAQRFGGFSHGSSRGSCSCALCDRRTRRGDRREATRTEDKELRGYGDPSLNAEAMALKPAAAKFGLGLYLYHKE